MGGRGSLCGADPFGCNILFVCPVLRLPTCFQATARTHPRAVPGSAWVCPWSCFWTRELEGFFFFTLEGLSPTWNQIFRNNHEYGMSPECSQ